MTVSLRAAAPDDAAAIQEVRFMSWRAAYAALIPEALFTRFDRAAAAARHAERLASGAARALVAEIDGTTVAFATFGPCRDDDLPDAGEVYGLYVHPDNWSTGIGRALLPAAVDALGVRPVVLWVLRDNARARRFYELAGWASDGNVQDADILGELSLPELRYRLD